MTSQKQIEANKRNAQLSTGPRSPEGKARCSKNSLKHGLSAKSVIIEGEEETQFEALRCALLEEFEAKKPRGALEVHLIEQLAAVLWRLRRITAIEAGLFHFLSERQQLEASDAVLQTFPVITVQNSLFLDANAGTQASFGRVCDLIVNRGDVFGKLSRYETSLLKHCDYLLNQLNRET